jgi:Putative lumazine-binding
MKRIILISAFILLSISTLFAQDDQKREKELIKEVIQTAYVDGLCNNADEEAIKKGIHSGFQMQYTRSGNTLWKLPIYNWIEMAKDGKAKGNKYSFQDEFTTVKFLFIDITGKVAVTKIEFYEGEELNYIDYLSLLKFEDGWKIVSKMFHPIPKEKKEE